MMTPIREANEQYQRSMHQFMAAVRTLSPEQFLQEMHGWSPRDVVAHLIGWNYAGTEIVDSLGRGEVPELYVDPGDDFSKVNGEFVTRYDSTDMIELLRQMELSYQELAQHLFTLTPQEWTREVTIPDWPNPVTAEKYVLAICRDYEEHAQEILTWAESQPAQ